MLSCQAVNNADWLQGGIHAMICVVTGAVIPLMEQFRTLLDYGFCDWLDGEMGELLKVLQLLAHGSQAKHAFRAAGSDCSITGPLSQIYT